MESAIHVYEIRPRKDKYGVDLISDALPFGGLWYAQSSTADRIMPSSAFTMTLAT